MMSLPVRKPSGLMPWQQLKYVRNARNCIEGWSSCDHSALSAADASHVAVVEHQRNWSNCKSGQESCDYSQLTAAESKALARAEHQRNY